MKNVIKAFIAPHIDENYALCQDRIFVDSTNMFFSVSDGVSSSFAPTYYAEIISSYQSDNVVLTSNDARSIFSEWKKYMEGLKDSNQLGRASKQRYARGEKPAATFARLKFEKIDGNLLWNVSVLGDCTIIHLNLQSGISIVHVITSGEKFLNDNFIYNNFKPDYYRFGRMPDQLDEYGTMLSNQAVLESNKTEIQDCFILMTDGLSDWVLNNPEKTVERISILLRLETQADFIQLLRDERDNKREMENDDISFIKVLINSLDDVEIDTKSAITDIHELIEIEKSSQIEIQQNKIIDSGECVSLKDSDEQLNGVSQIGHNKKILKTDSHEDFSLEESVKKTDGNKSV